MNKKIENKTTIIFDFDGTIGDSLDFFVGFLCKEANKFGYDFTENKLRNLMRNKSLKEIFKMYKLSKIHVFYIVWKLRRDFKKVLEKVQLFEGIDVLLKDLSKKYELYLISSNDRKHVLKILKKNNLDNIFIKSYFKSSLFGKAKYLKKFLKNHKLEKEKVLYIGDELRDYEAFKNIDVDCLNVSYGFNSRKLLETENKLIVDSVKELRKELLK